MTGAGGPAKAPRARLPGRWWRWLAGGVAALLLAAVAAGVLLDTAIGHRWLANKIAALRPANGMRYAVGRINGSIYSRATFIDVQVSDPKGLVFAAPRATLAWNPFAWALNRLDITRIDIPIARLWRLPAPRQTGAQGAILPGFDVHLGALSMPRLFLSAKVAGQARVAQLRGRADVQGGHALVDLNALVARSDALSLYLDAAPDQNRFKLALLARGAAGGVLATLSGTGRPVALRVAGNGQWQMWRGRLRAVAGGEQLADVALENRAGTFVLAGTANLAGITKGKLRQLAGARVLLRARGTLARRVLTGEASIRSAAVDLVATGGLDLAKSAVRSARITARLVDPKALFADMSGKNIALRAIVEGPFATASFDYRLTAAHIAFGQAGFEAVAASGQGRLSTFPIRVPMAVSAQRVTGVGDVAGGILRNLAVRGVFAVTPAHILSQALTFRSDRLNGVAMLRLDMRTGHYNIGLNGALGHYFIAGLGLVDVTTRLQIIPAATGRGARVLGTGAAQVLRLDNGFLASLAGGLPRVTTGLERTADGVFHFSNLALKAPAIRLAGAGLRRRDGDFYLDGRGSHRDYGPFTLKLDGQINRPRISLALAHPNAAMGLAGVRAHLEPVAGGYRFVASGGSRLGDFSGNGQIALPVGETATIAIAALDIGGIKGSGALTPQTGGLSGTVRLAGSGVTGVLGFAPLNGVQRIEAHLDAANAAVLGTARLRRGHVDAVVLLDPAGVSVEANGRATGLQQGALGIARLSGSASLRGGAGKVELAIAGARGRAFDIRAAADVTPDSYRINLAGTVDRRQIKLAMPAVVALVDGGWRLAPVQIAFAGGSATISGRLAAQGASLEAKLAQLPLAVLDIGYPGLGLSGNASGSLAFSQAGGAAPTGRVEMTVRGLGRAGLVLSSQPVDLGVAGVLSADTAALRAIMMSGGRVIGRGQARLAPLGAGTLVERLANAALFAQVRYDGPADTLWRFTGVELFDLSGPVAIGADLGGRVNDPRIRGVLRAKGARIESAATGTVLTGVQAAGSFAGSRLSITSFAADAGKGGRVTGTGSFDFAAVNGFGINLSLIATNAAMISRDDIGATVTGPLVIHSDGAGGVISGNVRLNSARYRLGQAIAAAQVPTLNVREINLPDGDEAAPATRLAPWRLDLGARADRGLMVTGLGLSSEWSTDLHIGGAPDSPSITGRADLVRGTYEFSGREFTLDRGVIRFGGEVPANPTLDIAANADSTGLLASIRVTGPAVKPQISFASTPALPQDELLSRLLFGTSITKLSAPEALQLAAAVAALQSPDGGLNPINALRRAARLDRLRILPADIAAGRTTSVAAGKFITRRLYAEIITDGAGYSATQVEFQVTRWLSILSTISTIGRQSVNVRVSKDY